MGAAASAAPAGDGELSARGALEALEAEQLARALAASAADTGGPPPGAAQHAAAPPGYPHFSDAAAAAAGGPRRAAGGAAQQRSGLHSARGAAAAADEDADLALALSLAEEEASAAAAAQGLWRPTAAEPLSAAAVPLPRAPPPLFRPAPPGDAALAAALAAQDAHAASGGPFCLGGSGGGRARAATDADADAALARALQADEDAAAAAAAPPPRTPPVPPAARHAGTSALGAPFSLLPPAAGACPGCGAPVSLFSGAITALGRTWHEGCFRCALCGKRITERTFAFTPAGDGGSAAAVASPCHPACHKAAYHPRCAVCHDYIPAKPDGSISYSVTPVWEERWCPEHAADGTRRCCGCERMEPRAATTARGGGGGGAAAAQHASLPDGRSLCVACVPAAVIDEADAAPLYDDVCAFYAHLGVPLPSRPPLRLVDAGVLSALAQRADAPHELPLGAGGAPDAIGSIADGANPPPAAGMLRGVTLSEEVVLRPVARAASAAAAAMWGLAPPEALPRRLGCRVTCIALLSALPQLLAGAVLAHEACHALLRLQPGVPHPLPPRVEEGVCQLMGLLWLEREAARLTEPRAVAHAAQLAHAIRTDVSEVYGGGARDALRAYQAVGLARLLDAVRSTGRLPDVP